MSDNAAREVLGSQPAPRPPRRWGVWRVLTIASLLGCLVVAGWWRDKSVVVEQGAQGGAQQAEILAPTLDQGAVHFRGEAVALPEGLDSVAATSAAILMLSGLGSSESTLTLVLAGDLISVSAEPVLGVPIGDIDGTLAAWTERTGESARIRAVDTASGKLLTGPVVDVGMRVLAVDNEAVFVGPVDGPPSVWTVGTQSLEPLPGPVFSSMLSDATDDRRFYVGRDISVVTDGTGRTVREFEGTQFGTFSPRGRGVLLAGGPLPQIWDGEHTTQALVLPKGFLVESARWTSDGMVLVRGAPDVSDGILNPDSNMEYFLCDPRDWTCTSLPPVKLAASEADAYAADAFGQLRVFLSE